MPGHVAGGPQSRRYRPIRSEESELIAELYALRQSAFFLKTCAVAPPLLCADR